MVASKVPAPVHCTSCAITALNQALAYTPHEYYARLGRRLLFYPSHPPTVF